MSSSHPLAHRAAASVAAALLLCSIGGLAAAKEPVPGPRPDVAERLRAGQLRFARTARPAASLGAAADPRAHAVADGLRAALGALRTRDAEAVGVSGPRPWRARGEALRRTVRDERGLPVEVRRAAGAVTPRQIRGTHLEDAADVGGTRAERATATARRFLQRRRRLLRLRDPAAEMRAESVTVDDLGCSQVRFAQTHRGLDVWGAALVVQVREDGAVDALTGAFVPTPRRLVTRPTLDAAGAADRARAAVPGAEAAQVGPPELIVHARAGARPRLAWKVAVTLSEASRWFVAVDAHTGRVLDAFDQVAHEDVAGSGTDLLGQTRSLHVWHDDGDYYMADTSKQMFDPTSAPPNPFTTRGGIVVIDARNTGPEGSLQAFHVTSSSPSSWPLADAVSAAFGLSQTYDYFLERHGRNSLDGQGGTLLAIVRVGNGFENAFWNGEYMAFGDAEPYAASLDVVGHELAHGVTESTAGLVYKDQSGALNEAFSDIFGEMVEARTTGGGHDWKVGTELAAPLRDMRDPSSLLIAPGLPYPSRMSQLVQTAQDNGGVHLNSSIINRAFYLLAEGLPDAVGPAAAERIFYRTLTTKLVVQSRFIDCRLGAIASAQELFGVGSAEARATAAAFDAVEILDATPTPAPPPAPAIAGADATLFLYVDPDVLAPFLGRRETDLGDPAQGSPLTTFDVGESRPSVSGDGSVAAFVDSIDDVCLIDTQGLAAEQCAGVPGTVHSVAMSPDGSKFAFVLLDELGGPDGSITVVDLVADTERTFPLQAPLLDGGTIDVLLADAMTFTRDGDALVYDAFNVVSLADGSQLGLWSIYGLDLVDETFFTVVPPTPGFDLGNPSLGHTSDRYLTFEAYDSAAGDTTVLAMDLFSGDLAGVVTVPDATVLSVPCFTGDDRAVVFTVPSATNTGASLLRQGLAADHLTPEGSLATWLDDAAYGVVYRRGDLPPEPLPSEIELTFTTGLPRLESLAVDVPVGGTTVPVRLSLAHDVAGAFTAGGTCTVGGDPVQVSGGLTYRASTGTFGYALTLRSTVPKTRVKLRGDVGAATVRAKYKGPAGSTKSSDVAVAATSAFVPTTRVTLAPTVDFLGRIGGTGTILGGFGNDLGAIGSLTGKLRSGSLKLVLKDRVARRKLVFKGLRGAGAFVGRLKLKIPPAAGSVEGFSVPDVFGF